MVLQISVPFLHEQNVHSLKKSPDLQNKQQLFGDMPTESPVEAFSVRHTQTKNKERAELENRILQLPGRALQAPELALVSSSNHKMSSALASNAAVLWQGTFECLVFLLNC